MNVNRTSRRDDLPGIRRGPTRQESAGRSIPRANTEALEPFESGGADPIDSYQRGSRAGPGVANSEPAQVVGRIPEKKLFCRLPRPMQQALMAHLTCGEQSPDG
ncbi:MAG TPA: hypothetical protein VGY49_04085 [Burkholderiaceae bacterium]|jgi:hypothetical protein|nr:hypothetical protein [Burkholderiaceae bacterium]